MRAARRSRRSGPGDRLLALFRRLRAEIAALLGERPGPAGDGTRPVDPYRASSRSYRQAVRRPDYAAYTLAFFLVIVVLGAALFYGVSWAMTGNAGGLAAQLLGRPTPAPTARGTPVPAAGTVPPTQPAAATLGALPTLPPVAPTLAPTATPAPRIHKIEAGDTLFGLARRYGTTIEAIMAANGFGDRNRTLRIGEELIIPPAPTAGPAALPTPVPTRVPGDR